ncbi:G-D-S-L family lipolytic protein [Echinicola sp. CAU 1574]|uniref:G-D-S-L family lipolytic protein n=1 Tax=Echinicola arenosa TaxID=2774144 RepID=A0ABR9AFM8_9BACT|nr:GDSL-type esterase/lipase family protein [Echinicola arenosa]MBD8487650.1 G-D-S-L family lipolytic protein [Echinicola arenosa]
MTFYNQKKQLSFLLLFTFFFIGSLNGLFAQEGPERFKNEVDQIIATTPIPNGNATVYLFTGSSSIRLWKNIPEYFPNKTIVNTGFGGSQTHELMHFADELIFRYKPNKIFIYEGDNDLASGKKPSTILKTMKKLITKIQSKLPDAEIVLISPKPSLSRWTLKEDYNTLNRLMEVYCEKTANVSFANVWDIALNESGEPIKEIFIEDGLHMNKKGYDLWAEVLENYFP